MNVLSYTKEQVEQLDERYKTLPPDVRQAMVAVDSSVVVKKIGENYKLSRAHTTILADVTGMVMLGITHPRDYTRHLIERLQLPKEKALVIAQEVNEQIFKPIRASLKKIHGIEDPQGSGVKDQVSGVEQEKEEGDGAEISEKKYKFDLRDTRFAPERPDDVKKLEDERERMILEEIQGQKLSRVVKSAKKDIRIDIKWDDEPPSQSSYNTGEDPYKEVI